MGPGLSGGRAVVLERCRDDPEPVVRGFGVVGAEGQVEAREHSSPADPRPQVGLAADEPRAVECYPSPEFA
jgi:hypothetical protein